MNSIEYEHIKEDVNDFSDDKLYNYFEIIVDEINARKMERATSKQFCREYCAS